MTSASYCHISHPIAPVWDTECKILILGSFPSVRSRDIMFFYGHPQNRFWRVCASVFETEIPQSTEEKIKFLLSNHIALWDVVASCDIRSSSDSSIRNVIPNDLSPILNASRIQHIFTIGTAATKLYEKFLYPVTNIPAVFLPSTSPANASYSLKKLCDAWEVIRSY